MAPCRSRADSGAAAARPGWSSRCPPRPRSTTRDSRPHDLPVPCQCGHALGLATQPPVVLPADRPEVAARAVAALPVRDVDEEPAVADEAGEGGDRLFDVVAAGVRLLGGEGAYQTLLADLVHRRVAPQVVLDELEDRLGRHRTGHAVARRDGGREPQVEGRLELLAPARLRRERRLPVNPEAPLVVDDAERARPPVPVDAIELTTEHELGERDGGALLEPDGLPVTECREVEGAEGLDGAHDLRKPRPEDTTERQVRLALEFRRDVGHGLRELRSQVIGVEVPRRQPSVEPLEQRMHELADLAGAQVFPFDDVVGGEDSQDLLGEVAEWAGGEALEAGRRQ